MAWHWKPAIWPPWRHVKTLYSIIRVYGGNKYSQRFTFRSPVNRSWWFVFHLKIIIHHQGKNSFLKIFRKKEQEKFNSYSFQFIKKGKNLTAKQSVFFFRIQVRASSQTKGLERGWKQRARLGRDARNTPRFTDFFTDFEKKTRLFCSLG